MTEKVKSDMATDLWQTLKIEGPEVVDVKPYKYYFRFLPFGSNCQRQQSFNGVGTAVKTMPQSNKDFRRIVKAIFSRSRFWADGILCHFVDLSLRSYLLSPVLVDLLMFLHKIYHERLHKSFTKLH